MIVRTTLKEVMSKPLTDEQRKMLEALQDKEPVPDDDCPEITSEQFAEFKRVSADRRAERVKQSVTLRLSPQTIEKAKSLGKGYTSILSRIIENALNDPEMIRKAL